MITIAVNKAVIEQIILNAFAPKSGFAMPDFGYYAGPRKRYSEGVAIYNGGFGDCISLCKSLGVSIDEFPKIKAIGPIMFKKAILDQVNRNDSLKPFGVRGYLSCVETDVAVDHGFVTVDDIISILEPLAPLHGPDFAKPELIQKEVDTRLAAYRERLARQEAHQETQQVAESAR
ncbi:MAG: hypothetical protein WAZ18_05940 [Alphaproteobacteria bacterium]